MAKVNFTNTVTIEQLVSMIPILSATTDDNDTHTTPIIVSEPGCGKKEIEESGIRIGAIFSAKLAALVNDASGALAGLDEATLRKKLHGRTQGILAEIRQELEKV